MSGIITVFKKEILDIISARSAKKQAVGWMIFIIMFGVFIPMSQASFWIRESQLLSFHLIFVPLMITYTCVTNSFAGKKNRCIQGSACPSITNRFIARAMAGFVFSYIFYMLISSIGVLSLNYVIYMNGEWHKPFLYSPPALFAFVFFGAGLVSFAVSTGVFISLKVASVKMAQLLSSGFYLLIGLPVMSGVIKISFTWDFVVPVCIMLFMIDLIFFAVAMRMFRRHEIVFDGDGSVYDA